MVGAGFALAVAATLADADGGGVVSVVAVAEGVEAVGGALAVVGVAVLAEGAAPEDEVDSVLVHARANAAKTTTDMRRSSMGTQLTRMR